MEAYTDFAQVYDELMDDIPYEEWCAFLLGIFRRYGVGDAAVTEADLETVDEKLRQERNTILDLGCGTGTLTELLAREGYDMIGVDNAEEMLRIAMEKRERSGLDILYLLQDMRELELYGTVGAVVSVCDSLNYLLNEEDIVQTFDRVNNYLYPQGIFIFDFNTVYKYQTVIGDATIAENREDCSFIWENYYHEDEEINEYDLTVFVAENQLFRRFQEVHYQRGYRLSQMKALLERAGLEFLEAMDADTHGEVRQESERIYVVARKGAGTTGNQTAI
ncbi:MAG: class I SAM-dependent methyltransferase [Lachnospiraceae bacterium]|nr:class I SAM-dependent methyltransferase [Lachnospiraceae bacterium]